MVVVLVGLGVGLGVVFGVGLGRTGAGDEAAVLGTGARKSGAVKAGFFFLGGDGVGVDTGAAADGEATRAPTPPAGPGSASGFPTAAGLPPPISRKRMPPTRTSAAAPADPATT